MEERRNEVEVKENPIKEVDISLNKVIKSVCKIIYENNVGTGFLIKLYKEEKEFKCLMANEHIITKEMIELNKIINIKYNCEEKWIKIKLDKNKRNIIYNKKLDVTIIEIKIEDKIKDKYFLLPNINNNIEYINKEIYIVQYPKGNKLSYSEGKIININNNELIHDASTTSGSSGSPILIKNTIEVIGIHKQGSNKKTENYGTLIYSIMQLLKTENNDIPHGKGILYNKNDNMIYDGEILNGKDEGNVKHIYKNGDYYIGQWLNGNRHGKGILYDKNNNIIYDGEFVDDKFEGNGKLIYDDGGYYIGQWLNNKKYGKGIIYDKDNNIIYDGDFVDDKFEGNGKYIYEDGDYYIGQWLNDKEHGRGIEFDENDNIIYEGEFVDGKRKSNCIII